MKDYIIAIIPARGGSKRIKNKNIKKFRGQSAISITIKKLKKSKIFSRIIVSTDNKKIMKISKMAGAETPFKRPKYLSNDYASDFPVRLVESGPAGGAILATSIAEDLKLDKVISFDMGGTTAKITIIENQQAIKAREFEVDRKARFKKGSGLPLRIPVIEMVEIGAGGGSNVSIGRRRASSCRSSRTRRSPNIRGIPDSLTMDLE